MTAENPSQVPVRGAATIATSMCELFQKTASIEPDAVALRDADDHVVLTWRDYAQQVREVAAGLAGLGIGPADVVALMLSNRPEFHVWDTAAMHLRAVSFSVYNTFAPETVQHVLQNSGASVVVYERAFAKTLELARSHGLPNVEHYVCIDGPTDADMSPADVIAAADDAFDFHGRWRSACPDDLLTLIYTSGTTGPPKGVEVSHANMLAQLASTAPNLPVDFGDIGLSAFPMAHIAERWGTHYTSQAFGLQIVTVRDPDRLPALLVKHRPRAWGSVPRLWEKLHAALIERFDTETDEEKHRAVAWALEVGRAWVAAGQRALAGGPGPTEELAQDYARADESVLSGIRHALGLDRLRWAVVGAAPMPAAVTEFFHAIGVPLLDIWGMSELSGVATLNPVNAPKIGTVGLPLPGVDLRIADDGEVLVRGATVMRGYRADPAQTAAAFDPHGWFRTGDIGTLDAEGYLTIIDRKKELIINAAGKNMSPANIESAIRSEDPLINYVVAIGEGRPFNVALVVLDSVADVSDKATIDRVRAAIERGNRKLARVEQIKTFTVITDGWAPGGRFLTPTLKLKRKPVAEHYASTIAALYESVPSARKGSVGYRRYGDRARS